MQIEHVDAAAPLKRPAMHDEQVVVDELLLLVPASHAVHDAAAVIKSVKYPSGHCRQVDWPVAIW